MDKHPGFNFCACPDAALTRQYIDQLVAKYPAPGGGKWTREVFWADDGLGNNFWDALTQQTLFGGGKVIVLRNAQTLLADSWKKLNKALATLNASSWLFVCLEVEFEKGQPKITAQAKKLKALDFAQKQGWFWSHPGLLGRGLQDYIVAEANSLGLVIPAPILAELCQILPSDATAIRLELEKLALALPAGEKQLTPQMLELLDEEVSIDVFSVLRNLQQPGSKPEQIWSMVLSSHTSRDKMLFPFLGALLREARTMWQLLFKENVYVPAGLAQQKTALAQQLGLRKLANFWDLALEAEQGVKSGAVSEEQALERLIASLFKLFNKA